MSLGEEIRKALAKARADAAVSQATKELDKVTLDARDERRFRPASVLLKELATCFPKRGKIKFEDILLGKGIYFIRLLHDIGSDYFYWDVTIRILDLSPNAYVYSVDITADQNAPLQSTGVYGRFSPGNEEGLIRAIAAVIAYYELHGHLYQIEPVLEKFTEALS